MKKVYSFIISIFVMLGCVMFSACGVSYDNLQMSFYSTEGEKLDEIQLLMKDDKSYKYGIKFDGIDSAEIGEIEIKSIPNRMATITALNVEGNIYYFDIKPQQSIQGTIQVKHWNSGKTATIQLAIDKHTKTVESNGNKLIIDIPDAETTQKYQINYTDILALDAGATDDIEYMLTTDSINNAFTNASSKVKFYNYDEDGELAQVLNPRQDAFTHIETSKDVPNDTKMTIYPVVSMKRHGIEPEPYESVKIDVTFLKILNESNVSLYSFDKLTHTNADGTVEYGGIYAGEEIVLVEKDGATYVYDDDKDLKSSYNTARFGFKYRAGTVDDPEWSDLGNYLEYYDIEFESASKTLFVNRVEDYYLIHAVSYSHEIEIVILRLVPKKSAGAIEAIEKIVKVKPVTKPSGVSVTMNGELLSDLDNIKLYDTYSNGKGSTFKFAPSPEYAYDKMKGVRIVINPELLNAQLGTGAGKVGVNPCYNTDGSVIDDADLSGTTKLRNHSQVLSFYIGQTGKPMDFVYSSTSMMMESQDVIYDQEVNIMYVDTGIASGGSSESKLLTITLKNICEDAPVYLSGITCNEKTLVFNHQAGVKNVNIRAGTLKGSAFTPVGDVKDEEYVYINKNASVDGEHGLFVPEDGVKGVQGNLQASEFNVNVAYESGELVGDSLQLKQNGKTTSDSSIIYSHSSSGGTSNVIFLIYDEGDLSAQLGIYKITFTHDSGYSKVIYVEIYEELNNANVTYALSVDGKYAFQNKTVKAGVAEYKYKDYTVDYIVANNRNGDNALTLEITECNTYDTDFIKSYEYTATMDGGDVDTYYFENKVDSKYQNISTLHFYHGTYIKDTPKFITLNVTLYVRQFSSIIEESKDLKKVEFSISFYVYEVIKASDFDIKDTDFELYRSDYLGEYNVDKSIFTQAINFKVADSNLWNYVIKQEQGAEFENTDPAVTGPDHNVVWKLAESQYKDSVTLNDNDDNSITLQFGKFGSTARYVCTIFATIRQFHGDIVLKFDVTVLTPVVTEKLIIKKQLDEYNTDNYNNYINLKLNESFTIEENEVEYYSSMGEVTHKGVAMMVTTINGDHVNGNVVSVEGNKITIGSEIRYNKLKLIVFASDALKYKTSTSISGVLDSIASGGLIISPNTENPEQYKQYMKAYVIIDIILSDGSKENPYLIRNAKEFWEIDDNASAKSAHYTLMTNIDLKEPNIHVEGFDGVINSYYDGKTQYNYSIYGLTFTGAYTYLFDNLTGSISNVNFIVKYDITTTVTKKDEIIRCGVFATNNGEMYNVSVNVHGSVSAVYSDKITSGSVYFGSLVAENYGKISYSREIVGASGRISLSGEVLTYAGGLVGVNYGHIHSSGVAGVDATYSLTHSVVFAYLADSGAIASMEIDATMLSHADSAVGGAVGYNAYYTNSEGKTVLPTINNIYVTGTILGQNNIGGVIGKNISPSTTVKPVFVSDIFNDITVMTADGYKNLVDYYKTEDKNSTVLIDNITMTDVESTVRINATGNNAGGLVGVDSYGRYIHSYYKILAHYDNGIIGGTYVGGLIGCAENSVLTYCYVSSYRWDYSDLTSMQSTAKSADISGDDYVGGLIGIADKGTIGWELNAGISGEASVIYNSSVNAFIKANAGVGHIGGLYTTKKYTDDDYVNDRVKRTFVVNAYFLGYIADVGDVGIKLISNSADYTLRETDVLVYAKSGGYSYSTDHFITSNSSGTNPSVSNPWGYSTDMNGGYVYLIYKGEPLVDIAPTEIEAIASAGGKGHRIDDTHVHFDYYDVNLSVEEVNYQTIKDKLEVKNTYNLTDVLSFSCKPEVIKELRLIASSSDSKVATISGNKLIIKGEGQAVLTFISVLNNAVTAEVYIDVAKPLGTTLILSESATDKNKDISGDTLYNTKGITEQYFLIQEGSVLGGTDKTFLTNDNVRFDVEVVAESYKPAESYVAGADYYKYDGKKYSNVSIADDSEFEAQKESLYIINNINISDYILIGGQAGTTTDNKMTVTLTEENAFTIRVKENAEHIIFHMQATPFKAVEFGGGVGGQLKGAIIKFDVMTYSGAYDILLSHNSAILYPNDTTTVTAFVSTDVALTEEMVNEFVTIVQIDGKNVADSIAKIEYIAMDPYDATNQLQKVKYRVTFTNGSSELDKKAVLRVYIQLKNGENSSVEFTVLPQRIDSVDIKNYIYTDINSKIIKESSVLRSDVEGLIILNIGPDNGYYDYLEIRDATGSEEIVFNQLKDFTTGEELLEANQVLPDRTGIRLKKLDSNVYYIKTLIDRGYSSRQHTVQVTPYLTGGVALSDPYDIDIDVRMLPSISATHVEPNGNTTTIEDIHSSTADPIYLAQGVESKILVETKNSNGSFNYNLSYTDNKDVKVESNINDTVGVNVGTDFNVTEYEDMLVIDFRDPTSIVGDTLYLKLTTSATIDKDIETTSVQLKFKIVDFVVHGVSVTPSVERKDMDSIYGNYGKEVDLEFYFGKTDISFYENGSYWDTEYYWQEDDTGLTGVKKAINDILNGLNNDKDASGNNQYLKLVKDESDAGAYSVEIDGSATTAMELKGNTLIVNSNTQIADLRVRMTLYLNGDIWQLAENPLDNENKDNIDETFDIGFVMQNSIKDAKVIKTPEEFLAIEKDDSTHYILANDIILGAKTPYSPIAVDKVIQFDGNGHKITITQFAEFGAGSINMGLFATIPNTMTVCNLTVDYDETAFGRVNVNSGKFNVRSYYDLCTEGVQYTDAKFGGITTSNAGVITNCKVTGQVALHASNLNNSGGTDTAFNIGGLVTNNSGYITHSVSAIRIFALANIGGFVHTNSGKIASSVFNGVVCEYNPINDQETIVAQAAGFVVSNTGNISMSYSDIDTTGGVQNFMTLDDSAGFVYSNGGNIFDCYVDMQTLNSDNFNAYFAGFVYINSNAIDRCYSYINNSGSCYNNNTRMYMFAPPNTTGITNSYEIVNDKDRPSEMNDVEQILYTDRARSDRYPALNFGDNINSIWIASSKNPPVLSSTQNQVVARETGAIAYTYNEYTGMLYRGIKNIFEYEIEYYEEGSLTPNKRIVREVLLGNYGSYNDPYLIYDVDSWNTYLSDELPRYYRIVRDIDFANANPVTKDKILYGNLEGNNMTVSNYLIDSSESLDSIGLFREIAKSTTNKITTVVKNLNIKPYSIRATETKAVGALSGRLDGAHLYNIDVSGNTIILGGNAVGGIIGIATGALNMQGLYSSISVNSKREASPYVYTIYNSTNNNLDNNLESVSYAGSVIGIVDAYDNKTFNQNSTRDISKGYYYVIDVNVDGTITSIADSAGAAFGFVGERVYIDRASITLSAGKLYGVQYTGGVAGENRGVIANAHVEIVQQTEQYVSAFYKGNAVSAGVVGFNAGGLVINSSFNGYIENNGAESIVAGIVGRNVNGSVVSCTADGMMKAYITGGIIGAEYTYDTLTRRASGAGAVSKASLRAMPANAVEYINGSATNKINHLTNVAVKDELLKYWFANIDSFYRYYDLESSGEITQSFIKVLGLAVGLSDQDSVATSFGYDDDNKEFVINGSHNPNAVGIVYDAKLNKTVTADTPLSEIVSMSNLDQTYIMYLLGAQVSNFDYWLGRSYSEDIVVFTSETVTPLTLGLGNPKTEVFYIEKVLATKDTPEYYLIHSDITTVNLNIRNIKSDFDDNQISSIEITGKLSITSGFPKVLGIDVTNTDITEVTITGVKNGENSAYVIRFKLASVT